MDSETFGCVNCWPTSADAAWEARSKLLVEFTLVDESHFHVVICVCQSCSQRFVSAFTETIDWVDGEDPQFWTLLPITEQEALGLVQADRRLEAVLNALGPQRRSLRHDFPKGEDPTTYWSSGISVGAHD